VAVRLPPFWVERPAVWFAQAEAQFSLAGISDERAKFRHVISQLDHRFAAEVEDLIISPPQQDPYTKLRTELLNRLPPSREQRVCQLLTPEPMGDRKPSQFLRHLRSLVPDHLLRTIWTSQLPQDVQTALAAQPNVKLDTGGRCADRIAEAVSRSALASIGQPTDNAELAKRIAELSRRMEALSTERNRPCSRDRPSGSRDRRPYNRSPPRHSTATNSCWYHRRYGEQAYNCSPHCTYSKQTSAAANVCTTPTGRLFVTDRSSRQRFLIDTGSDLCVFPRKLIPQHRERVNYDLCAANGTTIPTYGWLPLSFNLGLRRDFIWRFVAADVTHPLIGVDFPLAYSSSLPFPLACETPPRRSSTL
jgi:hypothetical protein